MATTSFLIPVGPCVWQGLHEHGFADGEHRDVCAYAERHREDDGYAKRRFADDDTAGLTEVMPQHALLDDIFERLVTFGPNVARVAVRHVQRWVCPKRRGGKWVRRRTRVGRFRMKSAFVTTPTPIRARFPTSFIVQKLSVAEDAEAAKKDLATAY